MNNIIRLIIQRLFDIEISNDEAVLFEAPYNFTACDIIYVIAEFLNKNGFADIKIKNTDIEFADFSTINEISVFLEKITKSHIS